MRTVSGAVRAAVLLAVLAACGTSHSTPDSASSEGSGALAAGVPAAGSGLTAEDMRVNAGEVADGLRLLRTVVNDVANSVGSDPGSAADAQGRIEPIWSSIEGTVKATEPDTYHLLENQFGIIQKALNPADPVKERAAADAVVKAADGYLSRHAGASTSAPGGDSDPVGGTN